MRSRFGSFVLLIVVGFVTSTLAGENAAVGAVATCGNGIVESGEACDDGNLVDGDGCNQFCRLECDAHCDCPQGEFCYKGTCLRDAAQAVYCCANEGCPPGAACITPDGDKSRCGEDPSYECASVCDCGPAHCCKDGRCVKDVDDPWLPGGYEVGTPCERGVDATFCASFPDCFSGVANWWDAGLSADFRCFYRDKGEVRPYCGTGQCWYAGDCSAGSSCVDSRGFPGALGAPLTLGSIDGGYCTSNAIAETVFGFAPQQLVQPCSGCGTPGAACAAGWRPDGAAVIVQVQGACGSCGNGICEPDLLETGATCSADCSCGDGLCDLSEVGLCGLDCGACDASGCEQPIVPTAWSSMSACGDGVCQTEGTIPEDCVNCPLDCSGDTDGDGAPDSCEGCPADPDKTEPGLCGCGVADSDADADGLVLCADNCPEVANPDQADFDADLVGDACDVDDDGDGVLDTADVYPFSDLRRWVVIDGVLVRVENRVLPNGASFMDLLGTAIDGAASHGEFVGDVALLVGEWREAGMIATTEAGMIVSTAARSAVP